MTDIRIVALQGEVSGSVVPSPHDTTGRPDTSQDANVRDGDFYLLREVEVELFQAIRRFDPFNSPHEGKAVIEEELDELWDHVKANTGRSAKARAEAIQIAAMALRYVMDVCDVD